MPHTQKNRLPRCNQSGYISAAPYKTGAGIGTPLTTKAHNRASGFFVRTVLSRFFRAKIMVGRAGPTSVGPGSLVAGSSNPVRLTTPSLEPLDGELSKLTTKEATPWQTAKSAALSRSVVTSRLKSTADYIAHPTWHSLCTSTCCTNAAMLYLIPILPLSSVIYLMICTSFSGSSNNKTQPTKTSNRPLLHSAAGGLRTSEAWRIL
ncbi:hypothetical protein HF677_007470 [Citrobacter sp. TSA-1]|nr:hypothetical protein CIK43_19110 [Citrobacter sp. TSA-1]QKE19516.1 hypothetical protein HF677_007470 [Citrobacter sp. TSA-1]